MSGLVRRRRATREGSPRVRSHRQSRQWLPALLDGTLAPASEQEVRAHVGACRRCSRRLEELVASEALLARLPAAFVPVEHSRASEARLRRLARWAPEPPLSWQERGLSALGACAAAAMLAVVLFAGSLVPETPRQHPITLAAVLPETRLLPTGLR